MSNKDYELIARSLRRVFEFKRLSYDTKNVLKRRDLQTWEDCCLALAQDLVESNSRFDGRRFLEACGVRDA